MPTHTITRTMISTPDGKHDSDHGESSPSPSEVLTIFLNFLRHYWDAPREKAKWTESATVVLNVLIAAAAIYSAWVFQGQLTEVKNSTRWSVESFRLDERSWVELEQIKPVLFAKAGLRSVFTYELYPRNVGKTVARDVVMKAQVVGSGEMLGTNESMIKAEQEKYLLNQFTEMGTGNPVVVTASPIPQVLAPNTTAPVPYLLHGQEPQIFKNGTAYYDYLIGRLDYVDQFRVPHWMTFCFFVLDQRGELRACQYGNDEDRNSETPP
jgi:hypothetical protein